MPRSRNAKLPRNVIQTLMLSININITIKTDRLEYTVYFRGSVISLLCCFL